MISSERARRRLKRVTTMVAIAALSVGAASALGSHRTLSRHEARAAAIAINLRSKDLPRLASQSNPITAQQRRFSAQLTSCLGGVPDRLAYAEAQSPTFTGSGSSSLTISSTSEILPSAALVAKDLAAVEGAKGIPCLQSQLGAQLRGTLAKGDTLQIHGAPLPAVVSGSDGTFALRFVVTVNLKQGRKSISVPVYYDTIGFAYGQAEVGFDVLTTTAQPSATLERRLGATLLARARAAIG
ncbi:MAG TPA: hypothetical protein VGG41_21060 [Solirubrobacteraceae bacterium]